MNEIEILARAFGQGRATAPEVIEAARAADVGYAYCPADSYDEMGRREQADESAPSTGWDAITGAWIDDALSDAQYDELRALYLNG